MTIFCTFSNCGKAFTPTNRRQRFCSPRCRAAGHYAPTKAANFREKLARFRQRRRSVSLGFDGRHGGPVNVNYLGTKSAGQPGTGEET